MFLSIVLIGIVIAILVLVASVALIVFIYSIVKKNVDLQKKSLKVAIPSVIILVLLTGVNIFLIITCLHKNGEEIINKSIEISSDIVSKSFTSTFQNFEKNWDKKKLSQLEKLSISLESIDYELVGDTKKYTVGMVFDNAGPIEVKLYFEDLLGNNYLSASDKNDFIYLLKLKDKVNNIILAGKSRYYFTVEVPKDVEIDHIKYVNKNIMLE